jgi:hypothetical protein
MAHPLPTGNVVAEHQPLTYASKGNASPTQPSMWFFIITLTAFLARDIPLSNNAKPDCMKNQHSGQHDPSNIYGLISSGMSEK